MTSTAAPPRRVALVTGGTGGIGGGVVTALAQRGFDVVVTDRSIGGHARGRRAGGRAMAAGAAIPVDGGMHLHY
jgi:NAD(P)-dependent dehydrogenase (short-subunit alcohol dehydrogenase family)